MEETPIVEKEEDGLDRKPVDTRVKEQEKKKEKWTTSTIKEAINLGNRFFNCTELLIVVGMLITNGLWITAIYDSSWRQAIIIGLVMIIFMKLGWVFRKDIANSAKETTEKIRNTITKG